MKLTLGTGKAAIREARDVETALDVVDVLAIMPPVRRADYGNRGDLDAAKAEYGWYSFAQYQGQHRQAGAIIAPIEVLSFDIDEGELPELDGLSGVVLETATSAPEARRWRVHLDLAEPIAAGAYTALLEAFGAAYGLTFDHGAKDPARLWYRRVVGVAQELTGSGLPWRSLFGELSGPSAAEPVSVADAPALTLERRRQIVDYVSKIWAGNDMSSREDWIAAGMAIHASTGGHEWGLRLWESLSKRCPDKFSDGAETCAGNWRTFKMVGPLTSVEAQYGRLTPEVSEYGDVPEEFKRLTGAPEPTEWLWKNYLAQGALHLLAGAPGIGKSQAAISFAAAISKGGTWPDGTKAPYGDVIIFSTEDDVKRTILPRLIAAGANRERVYELERREDLERMVRSLRPLLVILDPITSGMKEQNDQAKVREQLEPYSKLARDTNVTFLGLSHFAKRTSDLPVHERVLGSTAFAAVARGVLVMGAGDHGNIFGIAKSNLGRLDDPWLYHIEDCTIAEGVESSHIVWDKQLPMTLEQAMYVSRGDVKTRQDGAERFILSMLENGPRESKELFEEAEANGYSKRVVERARERLGTLVSVYRPGKHWVWALVEESKQLETLLGVKA